jgi:hypothetical protein
MKSLIISVISINYLDILFLINAVEVISQDARSPHRKVKGQ